MQPDLLLTFLVGALMLIIGMGLFSLGAEQSMTPIGNQIGTALTRTKNLPLILAVSFLLGFAITIAEPDLQVLAQTVPHISNTVLLITVGAGVGFFMSVCMLRILTGMRLRLLLIFFYAIIFLLAFFADKNFLGIAFDSGGVTTGPMTVPFILALGLGVSNVRSDKNAEADSFGLVALCSIGPVLAVLILGFFYKDNAAVADLSTASYGTTTDIGYAFLHAIPHYLKETAIAMLPIIVIFFLFQFTLLHLDSRHLGKIMIGLLYTYIGLVLFLTGVNIGFSALGAELGAALSSGKSVWWLVPLAMAIGWFIISAEPAVAVLEKQIETVSAGAIPGRVIKRSLSIAIALAMGLSMIRVLTGISLFWFLIPGYATALILTFFVPDIYNLSVFHKWSESLAKAVYALTYAKGQLTYHVWLIFFGHVVRCRQHGALLAIPSDIGKVAESASGQDFSVCLEGVSKDTFSLYAYQYASGIENRFLLVDGYGYVLIYALCFVEGRNFVVVCFIVPCFHGNGIRCVCYEFNGDGRQVQGHASVLDRTGRCQDAHTAWDLLYLVSLHCVGCICFFTWKPVTFCEFHVFITS